MTPEQLDFWHEYDDAFDAHQIAAPLGLKNLLPDGTRRFFRNRPVSALAVFCLLRQAERLKEIRRRQVDLDRPAKKPAARVDAAVDQQSFGELVSP